MLPNFILTWETEPMIEGEKFYRGAQCLIGDGGGGGAVRLSVPGCIKFSYAMQHSTSIPKVLPSPLNVR